MASLSRGGHFSRGQFHADGILGPIGHQTGQRHAEVFIHGIQIDVLPGGLQRRNATDDVDSRSP